MIHYVKRLAIETEDWLRNHPLVRHWVGRWRLWADHFEAAGNAQELARSVARLAAAARQIQDPAAVRAVQARIRARVQHLDPAQVDWSEFVPHAYQPRVPRGVILKPWIGPREKGVLYVGFEMEWIKFLVQHRLREFAERYTLIVAPSQNPHNLVNYVLPACFPGPVYTTINHDEDVELLVGVSDNYRIIPLYTSHWVDAGGYRPRPREQRDLDLVMVAAWGKVKRHYALFRALQKMPGNLRIVLIGQDQEGRNADTIRQEARCYGVDGRFELWSNAAHAQVIEALCRAKVSVLLSRREGSAVVVAESLFADTPMGLLENCVNGSRAFINEHTGRFLRDRDLGEQLVDFIAQSDRYAPREWALANISCHESTRRLNDLLKRDMLADRQEWTRDLLPMCWRPDPCLVHHEDWLRVQPERADIKQRFGLDLGNA